MVDFTIALFLQLGLLLLLGRLLPGERKESAATRAWRPSMPVETTWEGAQRMVEREYGSCSMRGGFEDEE